MLPEVRLIVRRHVRHPIVLVFAVTIFLPALVLLAFGVNSFRRDRAAADREVRDRVERAADEVAAALERIAADWQRGLQEAAAAHTLDPARLPAPIARAVSEPGLGALVLLDATSVQVIPEKELLYDVRQADLEAPAEEPLVPGLAQAETAELRDKDYRRASQLYQRLLATADPQVRPLLTHRLARVYRKQGRIADAMITYRSLVGQHSAVWGDDPPLELVARYEICDMQALGGAGGDLAAEAAAFYRDLVDARWRLDRPLYLNYAAAARRWMELSGVRGPAYEGLRALEARRLALTEAVGEALAAAPTFGDATQDFRMLRSRLAPYSVAWAFAPRTPSGRRAGALIVADVVLSRDLWAPATSRIAARGFEVSATAADGSRLSASGRSSASSSGVPRATRVVSIFNSPIRLQLWPRDLDLFYRDHYARQRLYASALALVLGSLVFAGVVTVRVLRKELDVARQKSEFASTLSHEFRTPLTGIRQLAHLLKQERVPNEERRQEYYDLILRETGRLTRLAQSVLDSAWLGDGHERRYHFEPIETTAWLTRVAADFREEMAGSRVSLITAIPPDLPVLLGDDEALSAAVHNLLDNAVKYSSGRPAVWLDAKPSEGGVTVCVRDEGVGIAPEDAPHVFERYYRGRGETTRQVKGSGLGLTLVKHIVAAHDGTVELTSRPGQGTTFLLHLPTAAVAEGA